MSSIRLLPRQSLALIASQRNALPYIESGVTLELPHGQSRLLDAVHPHRRTHVAIDRGTPNDLRVRPQTARGNNRQQAVDMHDVIDFGIGGRRHGHAPVSWPSGGVAARNAALQPAFGGSQTCPASAVQISRSRPRSEVSVATPASLPRGTD